MDKLKTIAVNALVIFLVALVLIWGTTFWRQWRQFNKGETARAGGDTIGAIAGYESAIHMYTPLSPLVERSSSRLWDLADELVRRGEPEKGLIAYRSLRSSYCAVRGLTQPGESWIARCDERIAALAKTSRTN
jgi:hypothetical protein